MQICFTNFSIWHNEKPTFQNAVDGTLDMLGKQIDEKINTCTLCTYMYGKDYVTRY